MKRTVIGASCVKVCACLYVCVCACVFMCTCLCVHVCLHCTCMYVCARGMQQDRGQSVCRHEVGSHSSPSAVGGSETRRRADALLSLVSGSAPESR